MGPAKKLRTSFMDHVLSLSFNINFKRNMQSSEPENLKKSLFQGFGPFGCTNYKQMNSLGVSRSTKKTTFSPFT